MPDVRLFVPGTPAPKGSRTPGLRGDGSVFTRPAARGEEQWLEMVARVALGHRWRAPAPPYAVGLTFLMPRPARPEHPWPTRGDVDKLARAVLDGLVRGGLLEDDRHVVELQATKAWALADRDPGVEIVVTTAVALAEEAA